MLSGATRRFVLLSELLYRVRGARFGKTAETLSVGTEPVETG